MDGIRRVLSQYEAVLETLDEYRRGNASTESKSRAAGLYDRFSRGNMLLCLMLAVSVFEVLENLCTALQVRRTTVSGILQAASQTMSRLQEMRCDSHFLSLHEAAENSTTALCLKVLTLPRQCRPPRRREYTNNDQYMHDSPASYFKTVYLAACFISLSLVVLAKSLI